MKNKTPDWTTNINAWRRIALMTGAACGRIEAKKRKMINFLAHKHHLPAEANVLHNWITCGPLPELTADQVMAGQRMIALYEDFSHYNRAEKINNRAWNRLMVPCGAPTSPNTH